MPYLSVMQTTQINVPALSTTVIMAEYDHELILT